MAFLLGMAHISLIEFIRDERIPASQKQSLQEALSHLTKAIDELFYGKDKDE